MKEYPKIPNSKNCPNKSIVAFLKLDGSNLGWEWTPKRGFWKFQTRRRLFDHTDKYFAGAIPLFMDAYSEPLSKIFKDNKMFRGAEKIYAFTEFFGKDSFAGLHKVGDPTQKTVLFDIWIHKFGFLGPSDFIRTFSDKVEIPRILYEGKPNGTFLEDVRNGKYDIPNRSGEWDIMEGAVCKGGSGGHTGKDIWMFKVKTYKYLEKLKEVYANKWEDYWE